VIRGAPKKSKAVQAGTQLGVLDVEGNAAGKIAQSCASVRSREICASTPLRYGAPYRSRAPARALDRKGCERTRREAQHPPPDPAVFTQSLIVEMEAEPYAAGQVTDGFEPAPVEGEGTPTAVSTGSSK